MPQDLTSKKGLFLQGLANAVLAWYGARNQLKSLQEEYNTNPDLSGISQGDIDAAVALGFKVAFMTPTLIANLMTVAQPDLEQLLATGNVSRNAAELVHYLHLLPS